MATLKTKQKNWSKTGLVSYQTEKILIFPTRRGSSDVETNVSLCIDQTVIPGGKKLNEAYISEQSQLKFLSLTDIIAYRETLSK